MFFKNCDEKTVRAVFFGRYEATQTKSDKIEPEHLLLGLIREDKQMFRSLLDRSKVDLLTMTIRKRIVQNETTHGLDIPLSRVSNCIFNNSKKKANEAGQEIVYTDHLLLSFLEDKESGLSEILLDAGITIEKVKKGLERFNPEYIKRKAVLDELQKNTEALLGYLRSRNLDSPDWQKPFHQYLKEVHLLTSEVFH